MTDTELQHRIEAALTTIAAEPGMSLGQVTAYTVRFGLTVLSLCAPPDELDDFYRSACQEGRAMHSEMIAPNVRS